MDELDAAFAALGADPAVRGVILTGAGEKAFVAGADIGELATQSPVDGKERSIRGQRVLDRIEDLGKPVVAAVNGFALGGGCELALACHVRIASENARLGTPEVKLGIMCGYAGTQRLSRLVGKGRALELLLTGEMVDAQEALRIGLVNRVVAREKLLDEAEGLLRKMLANGPVSLRFTLEAVNAGLEMPFAEAQYLEATLFGLICTTEDMKEGTRAFLEKRPAKFLGK
jgi:enoyl-CoA hydratase